MSNAIESATDITGVEVRDRGVRTEGDPENNESIGIYAWATIRFTTRAGGYYYGPEITTPGCWDINGEDAEKFAHDTYGEEETELLDEMLLALGIKPR